MPGIRAGFSSETPGGDWPPTGGDVRVLAFSFSVSGDVVSVVSVDALKSHEWPEVARGGQATQGGKMGGQDTAEWESPPSCSRACSVTICLG